MAIYKFLNTVDKGENLRYCSNKQDTLPEFYDSLNDEDDEEQENSFISNQERTRQETSTNWSILLYG